MSLEIHPLLNKGCGDIATESVQERSLRDGATLLYQNGSGGMLISFAASTVMAFAFSGATPFLHLQLWWLLICILFMARLFDIVYWYTKIKGTRFSGLHYKHRYALGMAASSLLWAVYPFLVFKYLDIMDLACTIIVLSALAGGSSSVLSSYRRLAWVFITCTIIPISLLCLFSDIDEFVFIGSMGVAFWVVMLVLSKKTAEFTDMAVVVHNENLDLLHAMEEEKHAVSVANNALEKAYKHVNDVNETLELKVQERTVALKGLATRDPLTGLLNRKAFLTDLAHKIESVKKNGAKFAVFFLDLDGFKEINDLKGHVSGDRVLSVIATRILNMPDIDLSRCRWGGDEFIVTCSIDSNREAIDKSKNIYDLISKPITDGFDALQVGVTIGIAIYPDHGVTSDELIQAADIAMYSKKRDDKGGSIIFNTNLQNDIHSSQILTQDLHFAIEKQQLSLEYQPIVSSDDSAKPLCFEALLRWSRPEGKVSPDVFIPIAESSGAIVEIGRWVIFQACLDASLWRFDEKASVSVNISIRQMMDSSFLESVKEALDKTQLDASRLHLEITESVFAQDKETVIRKLKFLRNMKIKVSIDDFGTGFSSLSYLQLLPIDQIKIDQTFIRNIESGKAIVEATISIACALGCTVVAEGVETIEEKKCIQSLNIDFLQGFLFSKPLPEKKLASWYEHYFNSETK